jgi:DNA repair protein RecN (Recombination protein N)
LSVLAELRVENYVVMDAVSVEFEPGLNLLTGETGAGKSILVDALGMLLGDKASADVVRQGAEKAILAAVFQPESKRVAELLEQNGVSYDASEPLILRREVAANGKGRVFINNQPATVSVLRQLAPHLAVVHAQNESIARFDAAARLDLLDDFASIDDSSTAEAFAAWNQLRARIADLERDEQDRLRLVDLWSFQKKEIESAAAQPGEDEKLEAEKRVLANAEKIYGAAMDAFALLYDSERSAAAAIRSASKPLETLGCFEEKFREAAAQLDVARITVEDLGITLRDYAAGIEASPERLAEIEDRLALLERLKRKYGATLADVVAFGEDVARKLNEVIHRDEVLVELRKELAAAGERYLAAARAISRKRFAAAKELEKLVESEVNDLAMKASFRVQVGGADDPQNWTSSGFDEVQFLIATNAGEPVRPLDQIASGGEMSRVMLSLKVSIQKGVAKGNGSKRSARRPTTLVFDEIDTGIGGRAAEAVGRKLKSLARGNQVLCVTHLPQIASFADRHFCIEKREHGGRTRTSIVALSSEERRQEIARMLSGAKVTDASLKNAEQMLKANA